MAPKFTLFLFFAFLLSIGSAVHVINITDVTVESQLDVYPQENPDDIIDVDVHQSSELANYATQGYETGYARVVQACVHVQRGTKVSLNFRFMVRGVDARTVASSDSLFSSKAKQLLGFEESSKYNDLKKHYGGNIDIPFLHYLGFNLKNKFSSAEAESIRNKFGASTYDALSQEARSILSKYTATNVVITGSIHAHGTSFIPAEACALLQFSRVLFNKKESTNVFSTSKQDLVTGTPQGKPIPSDSGKYNIQTVYRRR